MALFGWCIEKRDQFNWSLHSIIQLINQLIQSIEPLENRKMGVDTKINEKQSFVNAAGSNVIMATIY